MKLPKEIREKKEITGTVGKEKKCIVIECDETAIRSLSENKWKNYVEKAKLKIEENKQHKIFLCKTHYKEVNKLRKSEEKLYQKKGFLDNSSATRRDKYLGE
ncbi:MAG: hypothetical protein ACFFBP_12430 [Promethearchaeota archaeon]